MLEQKIIDFIKKTIEIYENDIETAREAYDSSIYTYADEINRIKEDEKSILDIDMQVIRDILEESSVDATIKNRIYNSRSVFCE